MYQDYFGSVDTDAGLATILSRFDSQYIIDVVQDSLKMRFRPFNLPMPNMVQILERQFEIMYQMSPDYKEKIDQCKIDTYREIINIICNFYNLTYSEEVQSMDMQSLHSFAYILYDMFISRFTEHMINFFAGYIVRNVDDIIAMLDSNPNTIRIKDNTMYQSKQFTDQKWILIHQNVNNILYSMTAYDITIDQMIKYFAPDPNMADWINSLIIDNGNIYKNHYCIYILNESTASNVFTEVKFALQRNTQEQVYIGEF